ncbi:hypothetical protein [Nocardia sp. NPDC050406]|uniref:hypothetical protein n=1 Tax=Nocardia sp. NPDC050406 TaxID=3364318 RepID=UPI0037A47D22
MVSTAVAAEDPDTPDRPLSAPRPHLGVVPESPEADDLDGQRFSEMIFTAAEAERLPSASRHRIAAYIHLQLATLAEMGDEAEPA